MTENKGLDEEKRRKDLEKVLEHLDEIPEFQRGVLVGMMQTIKNTWLLEKKPVA